MIRLVLVSFFLLSFLFTRSQDSLKAHLSTIRGIIESKDYTKVSLKFTGISPSKYDELVNKAVKGTQFKLIFNALDIPFSTAFFKFKSDTPKNKSEVKEFIEWLGFKQIYVNGREMDVNMLPINYHPAEVRDVEDARIVNKKQ